MTWKQFVDFLLEHHELVREFVFSGAGCELQSWMLPSDRLKDCCAFFISAAAVR
jgi:hypothetical protein